MAHQPSHPDTTTTLLPRRTILIALLAVTVVAPVIGTGTAHADTGTADADEPPGGDEYDIPDGIGSLPWW